MTIRLVAIDIDGTLRDSQQRLRPAVRAAVQAAIARGVLVTLATGRRLASAQAIAAELGVDLPLILHGGATIQDSRSGELLYAELMPAELVAAAVAAIIAADQQPVVFSQQGSGEQALLGPIERDNPGLSWWLSRQPDVQRLTPTGLAAAERVLGIQVFQSQDLLSGLAAAIGRHPGTRTLHWQPPASGFDGYLLSIQSAACSKAVALARLAARYGVAMDEIMAIGDHHNDLEMLAAVGLAVAMGNALPVVKQQADVIVASNDDDGVAEALRRFVLDGPLPA
jgi:hypothetical protein